MDCTWQALAKELIEAAEYFWHSGFDSSLRDDEYERNKHLETLEKAKAMFNNK